MDYSFEAFISWCDDVNIPATEGFRDILRKVGGGIVRAIQTIWRIITQAFRNVINGVKNFFINIAKKAKDKKAVMKVKTSSNKEVTVYKGDNGAYTLGITGQGTVTRKDTEEVSKVLASNKTAIAKDDDDKLKKKADAIFNTPENKKQVEDLQKRLRQFSDKLRERQEARKAEIEEAEKDQAPAKDLADQLKNLEGKDLGNVQKVLDEKKVDNILTDLDKAIKRSTLAAKAHIAKYNSGFSSLQKAMSEISNCTDRESAWKIWAAYSGNVYDDDRVKEKENKKGELDLIRMGLNESFSSEHFADRTVFKVLAPSITLLCTDHPEFVPKFQNKLNGMLASANKMYKDLAQYKKNIESLGSIADNAKCDEAKNYDKLLMQPAFELFDSMCNHFKWMINNIHGCIQASNGY